MPEAREIAGVLLPWLVVVAIAAGVIVAYRADRIAILVGLLFAAASFSRITAPLGPYRLRIEQPALVILLIVVALREREAIRRVVGAHRWLIAAAALYLGANVISSVLYAALPIDSLRIAGWLGLSMLGGLAVAALVARTPDAARQLPRWVIGAASIQVAVGLAAVVSEAVFRTTWGVQATDALLAKTYSLSWEANILAINLAMALAFVIVPDADTGLSGTRRWAVAIWLGLGLGLAYSRGGPLALLAALLVSGFLSAVRSPSDWLASLRHYIGIVLQPGVAAFAAVLLTVGSINVLTSRGVGWTTLAPSHVAATPKPSDGTPGGSSTPGSPNPNTPEPTPVYVGTGNTVEVRLDNISIALREVTRSPVVGLGTDSYQQRHIEPSCRCSAAIANLMVGALYDAGVIGLFGLSAFLAGVLYLAWSRAVWGYLASLIVMVAGYQATDALRMASNWILIGALIGLAVHLSRSPGPDRTHGDAERSMG